jgi:hypothetical protein
MEEILREGVNLLPQCATWSTGHWDCYPTKKQKKWHTKRSEMMNDGGVSVKVKINNLLLLSLKARSERRTTRRDSARKGRKVERGY